MVWGSMHPWWMRTITRVGEYPTHPPMADARGWLQTSKVAPVEWAWKQAIVELLGLCWGWEEVHPRLGCFPRQNSPTQGKNSKNVQTLLSTLASDLPGKWGEETVPRRHPASVSNPRQTQWFSRLGVDGGFLWSIISLLSDVYRCLFTSAQEQSHDKGNDSRWPQLLSNLVLWPDQRQRLIWGNNFIYGSLLGDALTW